MENPVKLRHLELLDVRRLGRQALSAYRSALHWCIFLILPTLSWLILAPFLIAIGVRGLLLSKKKLTHNCPHCGNSLGVPFTWQEESSLIREELAKSGEPI